MTGKTTVKFESLVGESIKTLFSYNEMDKILVVNISEYDHLSLKGRRLVIQFNPSQVDAYEEMQAKLIAHHKSIISDSMEDSNENIDEDVS